MPRGTVRSHTRQTKHGRVEVKQHSRAFDGVPTKPQWFQPRRAWRNAKQSRRLWKKSKTNASLLFGTAAVCEILGFVVFKGVGTIFIVAGVLFAVAGYAMRDRT